MMTHHLPPIPLVTGNTQQDLDRIKDYLYRLIGYFDGLQLVEPGDLTQYVTVDQMNAAITAAIAAITLTGGTFDAGTITP